MTPNICHVTPDKWVEVNLLSKIQLPSSYGLGVMVCWTYFHKGSRFLTVRSVGSAGNEKGLSAQPRPPWLLPAAWGDFSGLIIKKNISWLWIQIDIYYDTRNIPNIIYINSPSSAGAPTPLSAHGGALWLCPGKQSSISSPDQPGSFQQSGGIFRDWLFKKNYYPPYLLGPYATPCMLGLHGYAHGNAESRVDTPNKSKQFCLAEFYVITCFTPHRWKPV